MNETGRVVEGAGGPTYVVNPVNHSPSVYGRRRGSPINARGSLFIVKRNIAAKLAARARVTVNPNGNTTALKSFGLPATFGQRCC